MDRVKRKARDHAEEMTLLAERYDIATTVKDAKM